MKFILEPKVYLVGCQMIDYGGLNDFLEDEGVKDWTTDTMSDPQKLCEVAGRLCYMSFTKPRPGGNAAYLDNILQSGHGCYDIDTQVLTSGGWKDWPDVTKHDHLATLDKLGMLTYKKPVTMQSFHHKGRMYRVESQGVDLLVTPNHKMYVCQTTTKEGRLKNDFKLVEAQELNHVSHAYTKVAWHWQPEEDELFSTNLLRFLGFAIGDGYYKGGNQVRFRLRKQRKILWLRSVIESLREEEKGHWNLSFDGTDRFTVDMSKSGRESVKGIYTDDGEKCIPQNVLMHSERVALQGLLEGLTQSDGHESTTGTCFDTTSQLLADQVQQLCLHVGVAANVCYTYGPEDRPTSYGTKPLTRLTILQRSLKPEVNKWSGADGKTYWVDGWEGDVYCAQMPDDTQHILYVRRNGKPVWCGNSVLEHAVWNFIITGVSRSFSHELVRHRAGVGYSQLSQRYVDSSDCNFVVPWELQVEFRKGMEYLYENYPEWPKDAVWEMTGDALKRALDEKVDEMVLVGLGFIHSMLESVSDYTVITNYLFKKFDAPQGNKTEIRKRARQTARSVLPNATETKIFLTANARALRHMIEMRAAGPAEAEIRRVFVNIQKIMQEEAHNIFGDYTVEKLADGTSACSTTYKKV